jgi:hypothetical protein
MSREDDPHWLQNTTLVRSGDVDKVYRRFVQNWESAGADEEEGIDISDTLEEL